MTSTVLALSPGKAASVKVLVRYYKGKTAATNISFVASLGDSNASPPSFIYEAVFAKQRILPFLHTATRPFRLLL